MKIKAGYCEACSKHPVAYYVDSWFEDEPRSKLCCVCVDRMITFIPGVKKTLNITEINNDKV